MQNLLQLILRYSSVWSFLILEAISFYLVIQFNQKQNSIFLSSASQVSGSIYERYDKITDYLNLKKQVESLKQENSKLRALITNTNDSEFLHSTPLDSLIESSRYIAAGVINKSLIGRNNTITINKGRLHGVEPHMGVINSDGLVGIVRNVSDKYAVVMSVYHSKSRISALIKGKDLHGSLIWENMDNRYMNLKYIPKYYDEVSKGDTIVTSSYSNIFPSNIELGTIEEVREKQDDSNFIIKVKMNHQFHKLDYVYVVDFLDKEEKEELQKELNE